MTDDDVREMKRLYVKAGGKSYSKEIELCDYALALSAMNERQQADIQKIANDLQDRNESIIKLSATFRP